MRWAGSFLLFFGLIVLLGGMVFNTALQGTNNLGLLCDRICIVIFGSVFAVLGMIMACAGEILHQIQDKTPRSTQVVYAPPPLPPHKKTPEEIEAEEIFSASMRNSQ